MKTSKHTYAYPLRGRGVYKKALGLVGEFDPKLHYQLGPFLCGKSPNSHVGTSRHAIDFVAPIGTEVLAARAGTIVAIKDDSDRYGLATEYVAYTNFITVDHGGGEYSQYAHLGKKTVRRLGLKLGDTVKKGQVIGQVGMTGLTDIPHLHFAVFRLGRKPATKRGFSVKVRFR